MNWLCALGWHKWRTLTGMGVFQVCVRGQCGAGRHSIYDRATGKWSNWKVVELEEGIVKEKVKEAWICSTSFIFEIEGATSGTKVYPSKEALLENCECCRTEKMEDWDCTPVKVEVRLVDT